MWQPVLRALRKGKWCRNQEVSHVSANAWLPSQAPSCPSPPPSLLGAAGAASCPTPSCLPAQFLLAQRIPVLAGTGECSLLVPGSQAVCRTLPPASASSGVCYSRPCPVLRDCSCFEGKSGRSGLGSLGTRGVGGSAEAGGQEGCAFLQLRGWPRGRVPGAGLPWLRLQDPPRTTAERGGTSLLQSRAGPWGWPSLPGLCWGERGPWRHLLLPTSHPRRVASWCTFLHTAPVAMRPPAPRA